MDPQAAAGSSWAAPQCQNRGNIRQDGAQKENQHPEDSRAGSSHQMGQPRHGAVTTFASTKSYTQTFNPPPATYRFLNYHPSPHSHSQHQPPPKKRHLANLQTNIAKQQLRTELHPLEEERLDREGSECTSEGMAGIGEEVERGESMNEKAEGAAISPETSEGGGSGAQQDVPQTSSGGDTTYATLSAAAGKLSAWTSTSVATGTSGDLKQASPPREGSLTADVSAVKGTPHPHPPQRGPEGAEMVTPKPGRSCASPYTVGLLSNKKSLLPFQLRYKNLEAVLRDREAQLRYGSQTFHGAFV